MGDVKIISAISKKYADALLKTATELGSADYFMAQLTEVLEVLNSSSDLKIVMSNSSISTSKKLEIISEVFGGKIDVKLLNFLKILVEKNRFNELDSIKCAYAQQLQKINKVKTVEITSPIELNFENKSNILFKLEHKLQCEVKPIWTVDVGLIAGLKFKFDDCVIDTSVRTKLENLSKSINR